MNQLKTFYLWTKIITTISLLSLDLYGIVTPHPTGYAIMRGLVFGMCLYHIWFRGDFEEKQSSLPQKMVGKEQQTN